MSSKDYSKKKNFYKKTDPFLFIKMIPDPKNSSSDHFYQKNIKGGFTIICITNHYCALDSIPLKSGISQYNIHPFLGELMKQLYTFLFYLMLFLIPQLSYNASVDQDFDTQLNALQQSIDILVAQSDMDPEVAQDITEKINNLNQHVQANIKADVKDIKVAAALSSILEASNTIIQATTLANAQNLFNDLKHAARINTFHKLITSAFPGQLKDQPYYIDPYTESIGFILNNWLINGILQTLLTGIKVQIPGSTITLDITSPAQAWLLQAAAGVIAHYTWLLQKKLSFPAQQNV